MIGMRKPKLLLARQFFIFWRNPINLYIIVFVAFFLSSCWSSLREIVHITGLPANAHGLFSVSFTNGWINLAYSGGAVALLSSIPFLYPNHSQELLRLGQLRYTLLRLGQILLISITYTAFLFVCTWLVSGSMLDTSSRWGKVLNSFASGLFPADLHSIVQIPLALTQNYTPMQAAGGTALLFVLVMTSIGWIMFTLSNLFGREAAILFASATSIIDMAVIQLGLGYKMYNFSPWSWVRADIILDKTNPFIADLDTILIIIVCTFAISFILAVLSGISKIAAHKWQHIQI